MAKQINYDDIRNQVFEYIDKDALVARLKDLGAVDLNPFKYNNNMQPIGFSDTLMKAEGFAGELVHYLLWAVEKVVADAGEVAKGGEKKKALVQFLDNCIALPFWAEPFDGIVIDWLIDKAVDFLNKTFGKDWLDHIPVPVLAAPIKVVKKVAKLTVAEAKAEAKADAKLARAEAKADKGKYA